MIRLVGRVAYHDDTSEPLEVMQGEFAAWELYALRNGIPIQPDRAPPIIMLRYLAFAAVHRGQPRSEWPAYEEWDQSVADVELEGEALAGVEAAETAAFPQVRLGG